MKYDLSHIVELTDAKFKFRQLTQQGKTIELKGLSDVDEFNTVYSKTTDIIETYQSGAWVSSDNLRAMLRELSANHYHITKINIQAYADHNAVRFKHEGSVASGGIIADEEVPELRMTRKLLTTIDHNLWSMRSELSIIKSES